MTVRCTSGAVAVCTACDDGFYSFRHDEEQGRCLENSVTLAQAGFTTGSVEGGVVTASAVGLFSFWFSGSVPSDLASGEVAVPATASLSLTGTGVEVIGASFAVEGSLSLTNLGLESDISVSSCNASLSSCHGRLTELSAIDSKIDIDTTTSSVLTLRSVILNNAGSVALTGSTSEGGARVRLSGGTELSLTVMTAPLPLLSGEGSSAHLVDVTPLGFPNAEALTGTMTIRGGSLSSSPAGLAGWLDGFEGIFSVNSGPCTVSNGGRCVG